MRPAARLQIGILAAVLLPLLFLLPALAGAGETLAASAPAGSETASGAAEAPPPTPELHLAAETPGSSPLPLKDATSSDLLKEARGRGYLTLEDCYRIAVQENERIGRAREDYNQADLIKLQARGAILPQVTLEDNYYRQNKITIPISGSTASAFSFADSRNQVLLHLTQPIFSGFRERNFFKYAHANIDSFAFALQDARRLLYVGVAQDFYQILQLEGEVKALEDTVQVEQQRLKEVQARHDAGLARKTDVLLVESQLAQDESQLTSTRNDVQVARQQLGFLLTVPADLPLRDDSVTQETPAPGAPASPASEDAAREEEEKIQALVRTARENRSDLKQKESAVRAARAQVAVSRGARLPSIDLDAYGYLDRTNYSEFQDKTDWTAQINFTFPVFDGGTIKSDILTARSRLQQAILDRDELSRQVELDVRTAYLTLQSDAAQNKTLAVSVDSADENYRLVKEEYRSGLSTNLEVYAAQNQLLSARLTLERQKYQIGLDRAALNLAQGVLPSVPGPRPGAALPEPAPSQPEPTPPPQPPEGTTP